MGTPVSAVSKVAGTPAVAGTNDSGNAVVGTSKANPGYGVWGENDAGVGVGGGSKTGIGVFGITQTSTGVGGSSISGYGVQGISKSNNGVRGDSVSSFGVVGTTTAGDGKTAGVWGQDISADKTSCLGVRGDSTSGTGVAGFSASWHGVYGSSETDIGVLGESKSFDGVFGISHSSQHAGVSGHNDAGGVAGYFEGDVKVTGDLMLTGADFAEQFDLANSDSCEPGTVMVMNANGAVTESASAYDRKVVGVISGAGEYKPALVLDRKAEGSRAVIALMGKVYCKVDACEIPIRAGDLLTTSDRPGHAMKADGFERAFGAVIGKALQSLEEGCGLIPVLVNLQ